MEKITIEELMDVVERSLELYTSEYDRLKEAFEELLERKNKQIDNQPLITY